GNLTACETLLRRLYLRRGHQRPGARGADTMLGDLHLKNVWPAPEVHLEVKRRLNLLTGDNGLGKRFLLDIAWGALTRRWPAEVNPGLLTGRLARPTVPSRPAKIDFLPKMVPQGTAYRLREYRFDRQAQAWQGSEGHSNHSALVLYAQADG